MFSNKNQLYICIIRPWLEQCSNSHSEVHYNYGVCVMFQMLLADVMQSEIQHISTKEDTWTSGIVPEIAMGEYSHVVFPTYMTATYHIQCTPQLTDHRPL